MRDVYIARTVSNKFQRAESGVAAAHLESGDTLRPAARVFTRTQGVVKTPHLCATQHPANNNEYAPLMKLHTAAGFCNFFSLALALFFTARASAAGLHRSGIIYS
jgi:hypothetical protein